MSTADQSNSELHQRISAEDRSSSESRRRISGWTEIDDLDHPPDSIVVPFTGDTPWQFSGFEYDSGESTREITNPKSHSNQYCPWSKAVASSSQVAATNLNATARSPIIGLRAKMKLPSFAHRHRPPSIFPSWRNNNRSKKSGLSYSEPGSPKVSCWGNVLSEREKEKFRKHREARRKLEKKSSCCIRFSVVLTCVGHRGARRRIDSRGQLADVHPAHAEEVQRSPELNIIADEVVEVTRPSVEAEEEAVGLGALKRFSSGRRTDSWCSRRADFVDEKKGSNAAVVQENSFELTIG